MAGLTLNTVESETGVPIIHLQGEIDLHTCPQLRTVLQDLMEAGKCVIILNLAEVPYLDSAALGVLVDAVRRARESEGAIHLVQITPFVRRAFEITRLIKIFRVHDSLEAALEATRSSSGGNKPSGPAAS